MSMQIEPIAEIRTPYQTKFAIPRQPGIVSAAKGTIHFHAPFNDTNMLRGLEQFSHIWVLFCFHENAEQGWKSLVRPPRLGGNKQAGVLASRSPFRPNSIGMSLVALDAVEIDGAQGVLHVSGIDLLDRTPIIDIKPYLPYSDIQPNATGGYAETKPQLIEVSIPAKIKQQLEQIENTYNGFRTLVEQVLAQDPRPAYRKGKPDDKTYGVTLYHYDIKFTYPAVDRLEITEVMALDIQPVR